MKAAETKELSKNAVETINQKYYINVKSLFDIYCEIISKNIQKGDNYDF
jgi:hypothetical protein